MGGRAGASYFSVAVVSGPWSHAEAAGVAHVFKDLTWKPDWFSIVPPSYTERPVGLFPSWAIGRAATSRDGDTVYVWMADGKAQRAAQGGGS